MSRIATIAAVAVIICFCWFILLVVQGHSGCIGHAPVTAPLFRTDATSLLQEHQEWELACAAPRRWFFIEVGATIAIAILIALLPSNPKTRLAR